MERILWLVIMLPICILFTALGIYAWRRKKPMWFWSGSTVRESEISDVRAYNRANGIMWLAFSGVFWVAAVLGLFRMSAAGIVVGAGTLVAIPVLILVYGHIYNKYKVKR